ncbi:hypothetical protein AAZV13_20G105200 [Glycine max]
MVAHGFKNKTMGSLIMGACHQSSLCYILFIHNFRMAAMAIVSKTLLLFVILLVLLNMSLATAQPNFVKYYCIDKNGNYTANSTFHANLNTLLSNLSSNTEIDYGFYNFSNGQNSDKVNVIGMCRGDLKPESCRSCLKNSRILLTQLCPNQKEAIGWYDQCMLRYSTRSIFGIMESDPWYLIWNNRNATNEDQYNEVVGDLLKSLGNGAEAGDSHRMSKSGRTVIAIIMPIVSISTFVIFTCMYLTGRNRKNFESESEAEYEIEPTETLQLDFQTIIDATNNFADANKVGQGGFGPVYKGRLPNGKEVAIKRLSRGSGQGDIEFKNELLLVAKLQHRNLVRLLGFCLETGERILVYEFLPNKSLDYFIFDPIKRLFLDWERRYKIIEGISRGLLYLHEDSRLRIIHRDLKASNILLDDEMNPKISDFGMARLLVADQSLGNTIRVVGTFGYMAPEYAMHGHFSVKSDVFSFGVLVLEIVTGHRNGDIHDSGYVQHLISFVWRNWRKETALSIVDQTLSNYSRNEIMRCIHIGLLCVQENLVNRPTMATVVNMFSSNSLTLPVPSQPAYSMNARDPSDTRLDESRNNCMQASSNEASISELDPR